MNAKLPTVTIKTDDGPVLINKSDYDPENHELIESEAPTEPTAPAQKMLVNKEGRKHFVVGEDGKNIESEGIDAKGYGSEADAWAAIMALNAG